MKKSVHVYRQLHQGKNRVVATLRADMVLVKKVVQRNIYRNMTAVGWDCKVIRDAFGRDATHVEFSIVDDVHTRVFRAPIRRVMDGRVVRHHDIKSGEDYGAQFMLRFDAYDEVTPGYEREADLTYSLLASAHRIPPLVRRKEDYRQTELI